jgi:hypothetical protein
MSGPGGLQSDHYPSPHFASGGLEFPGGEVALDVFRPGVNDRHGVRLL